MVALDKLVIEKGKGRGIIEKEERKKGKRRIDGSG
jgi:hypothetical protein